MRSVIIHLALAAMLPAVGIGRTAEERFARDVILGAARNASALKEDGLAEQRYARLLRAFPEETAVRREYAGVLLRLARFADTAHELSILTAAAPDDLSLATQLADAFAWDGNTTEARAHYEIVLAREPGYPAARRGLAELMLGARATHRAIALVEPLSGDRRAQLILGRAYVQAGLLLPARVLYRGMLAADPADRDARRGLADAFTAGARYIEARVELAKLLVDHPDDVEALAALARSLRADRQVARAREVERRMAALTPVRPAPALPAAAEAAAGTLACDPANPLAVLLVAESRNTRDRAEARRAVDELQRLLVRWPGNERARLALARAHTAQRAFGPALVAYDRLLADDPGNQVARRERARVIAYDKGPGAARRVYSALREPSADSLLVRELATGLRRPLTHSLIEHAHLSDFQRAVALEQRAKFEKDWHDFEARDLFALLLAREPGNDEARFDFGQVLSTLGLSSSARIQYDELLEYHPGHAPARIARRRSALDERPHVRLALRHHDQSGRGVLAQVRRQSMRTVATFSAGPSAEDRAGLAFASLRHAPGDDPPLEGQALEVVLQRQPHERVRVWVNAGLETYPDRLEDRGTGVGRFQYAAGDGALLGLEAFRENASENGETLRQDLHRAGGRATATFSPVRDVAISAHGAVANWSDDNRSTEVNLHVGWQVTPPPRTFKLELNANYLDFEEETLFVADRVRGLRHPYFAPRDYATYLGSVDYRCTLSRDLFRGANEVWLEARWAHAVDSRAIDYDTWTLGGALDVVGRLSLAANARFTRSVVYTSDTVSAYLLARF